jgi:DNA polymerase III delta prime subunit
MYGNPIEDKILVEKLRQLRVKHIVITVGGGTQEQRGRYLKRELDHLPSIHCIGAVIALLSGDQVRIPDWGGLSRSQDEKPLLLEGPAGSGKTQLAFAVAAAAIQTSNGCNAIAVSLTRRPL